MGFASLVLAVALVAPIHGHNQQEYDDWLLNWEIQYHADSPFAYEMLQEKYDFLKRHPNGPTVEVHKDSGGQSLSLQSSTDRGMGNGTTDVEQWRPLVAGHFPPEQLENALCAIKWESGGNPNAKNPTSNARGLFQVMSSTWDEQFGFTYEEFFSPEKNTYAAAWIWSHYGWSHWSGRTQRKCGL